MKLTSLIYGIRSRVIGSWSFVRFAGRGAFSPFTASGRQFYYYALQRFAIRHAERLELPGTSSKQSTPQEPGKEPGKSSQQTTSANSSFIERQLGGLGRFGALKGFLGQQSSDGQEGSNSRAATTTQTVDAPDDKKIDLERIDQFAEVLLEEEEKLPLLTNRRHIQGRRGRYRVTHYLGRRGLGRFYEGTQTNDNKVVIIKEFLLPGHIFNRLEIQQIKQQFERLAGVNIAERTQDFRLIGAYEAIADDQENRCYLVTRGRENFGTTLRDYLSQNSAMTPRQVHGVLGQILQTLEFLHSHKFRLGDANLHRGLTHQNINLDSLLYQTCIKQEVFSDQQFFVYLTDLGIWEHLFHDPKVQKLKDTPSQFLPRRDLADLGRLGFHLLLGRDREEGKEQLLDPRHQALWPATDEALKHFILQLLGLNGNFDSAEDARLALPPIPAAHVVIPKPAEEEKDKKKGRRWRRALWITGGVATACLVGGLTWWGLSQIKFQQEEKERQAALEAYPCCIQKLDFPTGKFNYGSEQNGLWHFILRHPGLVSMGKTLEAALVQRAPQFKLNYQPQPSLETSLARLREGTLDFVVTTLPFKTPARDTIDAEFEVQPIAYDGVAVFVAFSDVHRDRNLANFLKGSISFAQLRQIYTGQFRNWKELGGPDLAIKLYKPADPKVLEIFESQVFGADEEALTRFRRLERSRITQAGTTRTLRDVLHDFEEKDTGSIGFDSLSKVFGQCSVYPLAVSSAAATGGIQALVQDNGAPVTPRSDLCDDKGSYWVNTNAFTQASPYPLRYDLVVISRRGGNAASPGQKFVDLWGTTEGQMLLSEAGLVPLIPLRK